MKTNLIRTVFLIALPLLSSQVLANSEEEHHHKGLEHLAQELNLSNAQQENLKAVFLEDRQKRKELQIEKIKRINQILSEDQRIQYEAFLLRRIEKDFQKHHHEDHK
jgi:Spy/CpxP family protein refolding chaperone